MLLPTGKCRLHEHAYPRAYRDEGGDRGGPLPVRRSFCETIAAAGGGHGLTASNNDIAFPGEQRMTALVTGATGFLGTPLVHRLARDGMRVRALVRSPEKAAGLARAGAEVVAGEITDSDAVRRAVDGVTVVYHLAGRLLVPGVSAREHRETHVEGTNLLLDSCRDGSSVRRLVHCSTT